MTPERVRAVTGWAPDVHQPLRPADESRRPQKNLKAFPCRDARLCKAGSFFPFDHELLRRVSPIEWKNVILYGLNGTLG